ncbi:MAG: HAD family phosphatase [Acidobacteriota bacterium]
MRRFEVLLFDLGGVLVEWVGSAGLLSLADGSLDAEAARRFWLESPWVRRFERGQCSPLEFACGVVEELGLRLPPEDFLVHFTGWDKGPFPGATLLLRELRGRYRLACLSNNNTVHWPCLRDEFSLGKLFDRCFISCEIGLVKPDPDVFRYVRRELGVPAGRILFIDDNPECTEAAAAEGFTVLTASGIEGVRQALEGVLGPWTPER